MHDAARALVTPQIFQAALDGWLSTAATAGIAAAPVTDTIKQAADGVVMRTLDRSTLWSVQTPQVFRRAALERALSARRRRARGGDRRRVARGACGGSVRIVATPRENMKITTPGDLHVAELALRERVS